MDELAPDTVYRVFISASDDVAAERETAEAVCRGLTAEFGGRVGFVVSVPAADVAERPSDDDLVICLLWKGLGRTLPPSFDRADGTPRTAIEFEFEDALEAALRQQTPDILVYKKRIIIDVEEAEAAGAELRALNAFWQKWFRNEQGHFTASFDSFDTPEQFGEKLRWHLRQWLLRRRQEVTWPVELKGSPYRSLEPFDAAHAGVFFGRRRAVRQIVARFAAASARSCAFLVVLGASGSGKSSIARAGVLPWLTEHKVVPEVAEWRSLVIRPAMLGDDPMAGLAVAMFAAGALPELVSTDYYSPERFADLARRSAESAAIVVSGALRTLHQPGDSRLLLVIDQFEELLGRSADDVAAILALLDALARGPRCWVMATLRSDRYPEFQGFPQVLRLKDEGASYDLLPPDQAEIREIIEGPARAAGLHLEESPDRSLAGLLEQASLERGSLPLLQFALHRLFLERAPADGIMLLSVYDRLGGMAGAIASEAERTIASLSHALQAALPHLLVNLVDIQAGGETPSARTLRLSSLADPDVRSLADQMVQSRFLVLEGSNQQITIRLAHEALLTRWPRLAGLVRDQRAFLATRSRLRVNAALWAASDRHPDFLLPSGRRVAEAEEALASHRSDLDSEIIEYAEVSVAAERQRASARAEAERLALLERANVAEARERAARRLVSRTRIAAVVVGVLLLGSIAVAGLWLSQVFVAKSREAEAEKNYATALKAASDSVSVVAKARLGGQLPNDIATALLDATKQTFNHLHGDERSDQIMSTRVELFSQIAQAAFLSGKLGDAQEPLRQVLKIAQEMVASEPTNDQWQLSLLRAHEELGLWSDQAGDLPAASGHFSEMVTICGRMTSKFPDSEYWKGLTAVSIQHQADTEREQGDLTKSVASYRDALDRLGSKAIQSSPLGQYETAVVRLGMARAVATQGDLSSAVEQARKALETFTSQHEKDKGNHNWEFLIALSQSALGDFLRVEGDLPGASDAFREAISMERSLTNGDKTNFLVRNNFAAARRGMADVLIMQNQTDEASKLYKSVIESIQNLAEKDPDNAFWQSNLGRMHGKVGDAAALLHDSATAEQEYRQGLAVEEHLARLDPTNGDWERDLLLMHARLSELLRGKGDLAAAQVDGRISEAILEKLAAHDPSNVDLQRDLGAIHGRLGLIDAAQNDPAAARAEFTACAAIAKPKFDRDLLYGLPEDMHDVCAARAAAN